MPELSRLRAAGRDSTYGPLSRYGHPHGWTIWKEVRDWDARPYRGSAGNPRTKVSWVIYRRNTSPRRLVESFDTLKAAREWCDAHKWDHATREVVDA